MPETGVALPSSFLAVKVSFSLAVRVLIPISAMLAAAGGMGGGGIFVPAFVLVAGFDLTRAVPLSTVFSNGVAVAAFHLSRNLN